MAHERRSAEAALLLRIWFEDGDPERMRVRSAPVLPPGASSSSTVHTSVDDVVQGVQEWLEAMIAAQSRDGR